MVFATGKTRAELAQEQAETDRMNAAVAAMESYHGSWRASQSQQESSSEDE